MACLAVSKKVQGGGKVTSKVLLWLGAGLVLISCNQESKTEPIPASEPTPIAQRIIRVEQLTGTAFVRGSNPDWSALKVGMKLQQQHEVRTESESEVQLRLDEGSLLTLKENSILKISELKLGADANQKHTQVQLEVGKLLFQIEKLTSQSSFKMETRTATAAVRGTAGGISTSGTQTLAYLQEGLLDLEHKGTRKVRQIKTNEVAVQDTSDFKVRNAPEPQSLELLIREAESVIHNPDLPAILKGLQSGDKGLDSLIQKNLQHYQKSLNKNFKADFSDLSVQKLVKNPEREVAKLVDKNQKIVSKDLQKKVNQTAKDLQKNTDAKTRRALEKKADQARKTLEKNSGNPTKAINDLLKP
jgi:hypothetical protein